MNIDASKGRVAIRTVQVTTTVFPCLVLFHAVGQSAPARAMDRFLEAVRSDEDASAPYLALVRSLYAEGPLPGPSVDAWQNYVMDRILSDENAFSRGAAQGVVPREMLDAVAYDLFGLQQLYGLTGEACQGTAGSGLPRWPGWENSAPEGSARRREMAARLASASDWAVLASELAEFYRTAGTGLINGFRYLSWDGQGLRGIKDPTTMGLDDLVGLAEAKSAVVRNTEQFVRGLPANNLLLYGGRGTGKSTMVRSLPLRYGEGGLRLVEVTRAGMATMPALFQQLKRHPQRFILFLDDLAFGDEEAEYKAFKSAMEGALEQRPDNVQLYATSNRRHLVPERWSDRNAPGAAEVHGQDGMEEKLSLADRFGVTVLFPSPSQSEYLAIVEGLVRQRGLKVDAETVKELALRWVMFHNPRSGRAARQFVDDLAGQFAED